MESHPAEQELPTVDRPIAGRRPLQVFLSIVAAVPLASGLYGMVGGAAAWPFSQPHVTATLDSEFRFTNAFWFAAGLVIYRIIPRIERDTALIRTVLGVVFLGGLARLPALVINGRPHPAFLGALALELIGVPVILLWQSRLARATRACDTAQLSEPTGRN